MKVEITLDDNLNVAMETSRQMTFTEIRRLITALLNMYELFSQYPVLKTGVARDPKPDEMKLQQGRKQSPTTRKPLAANHPASSHYWTKKRDAILREKFNDDLLVGHSLPAELSGFSLTEIRQRCIELKLLNQFGVRDHR